MQNTEIQRYVKHAERFGTEGVMETATETLIFGELVELQTAIDELDDKNWRAIHKFGKPPKRRVSARDRVKRLLGIDDQEEDQA